MANCWPPQLLFISNLSKGDLELHLGSVICSFPFGQGVMSNYLFYLVNCLEFIANGFSGKCDKSNHIF